MTPPSVLGAADAPIPPTMPTNGGGASPEPPDESWFGASRRGWGMWLRGGAGWKLVVAALAVLHLSFLPGSHILREGARFVARSVAGAFSPRETERQAPSWPPEPRSLWAPTAWDTAIFVDRPAVDFFSIHEAGRRARTGQDPYGINRPEDRLPVAAPYFASYRYLPIATYALAVPLSLVPPWWAYALWIVLLEALLLFNLGLTAAFAPSAVRRPLAALWLVFFPLHIEWHLGQFSFAMGCLIFWSGLALWRRGRANPTAGVVWWGLSGALKNWTLAFFPYWAMRGRRAALVAGAWMLVVLLTTAGYFVANPDRYENYYRDAGARRWAGGTDDLYWGRQGTQMIVAVLAARGKLPEQRDWESGRERWLHAAAARTNAAISLTALAAAVGLCVFRRRTAHPLDLLALVWLWWFIGYLDAWEHHYVMLLPMLALLGMAGRLSGWRLWIPAMLWATPSVWMIAGRAVATPSALAPVWVTAYFVQRPVAVAFVFVYLGWRALMSRNAKAEAEEKAEN